MTPPEIRINQTWPFEDGSVVELTCLAQINSHAATLNWNCTDIETSKQNIANCTHYSTKIIYTAAVEDNGRVCKCIATMGTVSISTSIKLHIRIKEIFSLDIYNQFLCNNSKEVQLSCTITSNALSFGFDSWTHTYNGVFIRHLKGTNVGNTSVVLINTCQFYDCGQYECRAWKRDESGLKWIEKAGELKVSGPPFIVETQAIFTPDLSFAAKFVSLPTAYYLEWYISEEVLNNSSKYNRTFTRDTFTVYMHGVPVTVAGYKATLTIDSKEEMETDEQVSLVLINELGKASYSFKLWKAPFEENEPNVYNEIVAESDGRMSNHHHQYFDIEISHEDTESNSYDESSNNC
ncbi:IGSF9B [Mytilus coruscus]|uniref:IGSF9B n=1 Tax=Mytilus coruscus TaxID=42192 RepID=A0A6J8CN88_MYTCO|nr:IGSF9B [Mytilus coruscus]